MIYGDRIIICVTCSRRGTVIDGRVATGHLALFGEFCREDGHRGELYRKSNNVGREKIHKHGCRCTEKWPDPWCG